MNSPNSANNSPSSTRRKKITPGTRSSAVLFNSSDLGSSFHTLSLKHKEFLTEQKLLDQFFYFKDEFIVLSQQLSIALPLDLVEDKSFSIYSFYSIDGPKYIFQVISSRFAIVRLARPGLTLLILFITYLRRHISELNSNNNNTWIKDLLPKLVDYFPINNIISILVNSQVNIIQELILTFLSGLLELIPEISHQLFVIPYFIQQQIQTSNFNFHAYYRQKHIQELEESYTNKINSIHASALTIKRRNNGTLEKVNHVEPFQDLFLDIMMSDQDFFNDSLYISEVNKRNQAQNVPISHTTTYLTLKYDQLCLSSLAHILTISMIQKNRHFVISSCADIIIALCKKSLPWYFVELIARTPTCPILLDNSVNNASGNNNNNSNNSNSKNSIRYKPDHSDNNNSNNSSSNNNGIDTSSLINSKIVDWAGIRILLKFLHRFHQLFHNNNANVEDEENADNLKNIATNSSTDLKNEFQYAHDRVLLAICCIIYYSNSAKFTSEPLDSTNLSMFSAYLTPSLIDLPIENSQTVSIFLCKLPGSVELLNLSMSKSNFFNENYERENITNDNLSFNESKFIISKSIEALNYQFDAYNNFLFRLSSNYSSLPSYLSENSIGSRAQSPNNPSRSRLNTARSNIGCMSRPVSSSKVSRPTSRNTSRPSTSNTISRDEQILKQKLKFVKSENPSVSRLSSSYFLTNNSIGNFDAKIKSENEKFSLFLQNQAQDIIQNSEKPSKYLQSSANTIQKTANLPLKSTANKLEDDSLLVNTFDVIDKNVQNQVIIEQNGVTETGGASEISNSKGENKYRVAIRPSLYDELEMDSSLSLTSISENGKNIKTNVSEYRDFFSKLSNPPKMPIRLEPKDIIVPNEDISKIRKKFKVLAEEALAQAAKEDVGLRHLSKKPIGACATSSTKVVYGSLKSPGATVSSRPGTSSSVSRPNTSNLSKPLDPNDNNFTNSFSMYNIPLTRPTSTSASGDKRYNHLDFRSVHAYSETSVFDDDLVPVQDTHVVATHQTEDEIKQAEIDRNQEEAIASSSFLPTKYKIELQSDPYNDLNEALTTFQPLISSVPPPKNNPTQISFLNTVSVDTFSGSKSSILEEKSTSCSRPYRPQLTHDYAPDLVL